MPVMSKQRKQPEKAPDKEAKERKRVGIALNVWIDQRLRDALTLAVKQSRPRTSVLRWSGRICGRRVRERRCSTPTL